MFDEPQIVQRYATRAKLRRVQRPLRNEDWLSDSECVELARFRHPQRREAWLAGRWLSKRLIADENDLCAADDRSIEICSRNIRGKGIRPIVSVEGHPRNGSLSISHSETAVFVALCRHPDRTVGVDLTPMKTYPAGFLKFWFTSTERQQIQTAGLRRAAEVWAVKEAVYKAANTGETFAPRRIEVLAEARGRFTCRYDGKLSPASGAIRVKPVGRDIAAIAVL